MIQEKSQWLRSDQTFPKVMCFFMSKITKISTFLINFCSIDLFQAKQKGLIDYCQYFSVCFFKLPPAPAQESSLKNNFLSFFSLLLLFFNHPTPTRFFSTQGPIKKPMRGVRTPLSPWWVISLNNGYRNT